MIASPGNIKWVREDAGFIMNDQDEIFQIAIKSRAYHADLFAAAQKMGGIVALARHLGLSAATISNWIRLHSFPSLKTTDKNGREKTNYKLARKWPGIIEKLFKLTGKSAKELFPDFVRLSGVFDAPKEVVQIREVNAGMMLGYSKDPLVLPLPERSISRQEVMKNLEPVINSLAPREKEILKMRFGLDPYDHEHDLRECGILLKLSKERVRQIEMRAFRKMREHQRAEKLKPALSELDFNECPKCKMFFPGFVHCEICKEVLCGDCMIEHRKIHGEPITHNQ